MKQKISRVKRNKFQTGCLFSLLFCLLVPALVFGKEDRKSFKGLVNFAIECKAQNKPIEGLSFSIYRLGSKGKDGTYHLKQAFKTYPLDFQKESLEDLSLALSAYVKKDGIKADYQAKTDAKGLLEISLDEGLYLIDGDDLTRGQTQYRVRPYLLYLDQSSLDREVVTCHPKFSEEKKTGQPIHLDVVKIWQDQGYEDQRPTTIEVELLENGQVKDRVKLKKANNWRHQWTGLDPQSSWLVVEKTIDSSPYSVLVRREDNHFTLINSLMKEKGVPSRPKKPKRGGQKKIPQTGQAWWPIYLLSGLGSVNLVLGFIYEKRRESK